MPGAGSKPVILTLFVPLRPIAFTPRTQTLAPVSSFHEATTVLGSISSIQPSELMMEEF